MQTFLPFPSYSDSARSLDRMRLGKQRVEAWQILRALRGESKGWTNHPATRMWRGYEFNLSVYGAIMCQEWLRRGYKDSLLPRFEAVMLSLPVSLPPEWVHRKDIHLSHQSNLIRKLPSHYGPQFPGVPDNLPYVWPVLS